MPTLSLSINFSFFHLNPKIKINLARLSLYLEEKKAQVAAKLPNILEQYNRNRTLQILFKIRLHLVVR